MITSCSPTRGAMVDFPSVPGRGEFLRQQTTCVVHNRVAVIIVVDGSGDPGVQAHQNSCTAACSHRRTSPPTMMDASRAASRRPDEPIIQDCAALLAGAGALVAAAPLATVSERLGLVRRFRGKAEDAAPSPWSRTWWLPANQRKRAGGARLSRLWSTSNANASTTED